jgi:hypothetical protein
MNTIIYRRAGKSDVKVSFDAGFIEKQKLYGGSEPCIIYVWQMTVIFSINYGYKIAVFCCLANCRKGS